MDGLRAQAREDNGLERSFAWRLLFFGDGGSTNILRLIRYVITLDTDTQFPRDAARQLVGTMAHPLNRPQIDPERGNVTEGYGLMQPRLDMTLASAGRSWFARLSRATRE